MSDKTYHMKSMEGVRILDHSLRTLHRRVISLVKVLWFKQGVEGATHDHKDGMQACFLRLFPPNGDDA